MNGTLVPGALDLPLLENLALALFIGGLVGTERGQRQHSDSSPYQFGGFRTFILVSLLGAISAWLGNVMNAPILFVATGLGVSGLLGLAYWMEAERTKGVPGLTTEMAAMVVFLLGGAAALGYQSTAVVLAIATTAVLAFKVTLHNVVEKVGHDDISAGLKLLFATFVILPLLPNEAVDPWNALNPYKLWWLVILISSLSLVGYISIRCLGERKGVLLTGAFGGLASSTAVTLSFAQQSQRSARSAGLALGIVVAWTIMFVRVVVEVAVVNPPLLAAVTPGLAAMGLVGGLVTLVWYRQDANQDTTSMKADEPVLKNPFSLWEAIKFGILFALVLVAVELVGLYTPEKWLYLVAALAGVTDVDSITLSMAESAGNGTVSATVASGSILVAVFVNTGVKCGMVFWFGSRDLAKRVLLVTGLLVATGGAVLVAQQVILSVP